jgi:hypothetical protein
MWKKLLRLQSNPAGKAPLTTASPAPLGLEGVENKNNDDESIDHNVCDAINGPDQDHNDPTFEGEK